MGDVELGDLKSGSQKILEGTAAAFFGNEYLKYFIVIFTLYSAIYKLAYTVFYLEQQSTL